MGYRNSNTGYRDDILANRSIVRRNWALIEPDGCVKNVIPGFENCDITILGSPKLGATFADYLITVHEGGNNTQGWGRSGEELFLYIFDGTLKVSDGEQEQIITAGGYIYVPEDKQIFFENASHEPAHGFMYKRLYDRLEGFEAHTVIGNINDVDWVEYEGMSDVLVKDFLPSASNLGFDMNMHILLFKPGASHGYIETHFQEHGAYIYSGQGMYVLDDEWLPVKKGDYLYMGAYCPQAAYAVGRDEDFAYIYSKDCNRDVAL
ncbi:(S)-ureidoglycine aminohydrolase [Collinsella sp. zg1085]|uniref:(S)-ureidoglycine aminohydrolase n=1 Tax=Collinsella sp. zg1085 TaxID=2844380 RepID=UPI001C0C9D86|nr:(S)-ureidoglycine aminohydrolase [Collinsella sp. zg1085]QWT17966.1 (S)-ureidoglycine aminohydrolase [Collinsella sp. zg1085]